MVIVGAIAVAWFVWIWGFCRFYVGPSQMAVITSKIGKPLPPGQILAEKGQKGILRDVLGEGRHFLNPIFYQRDIRTVVIIVPGKIGIVTSKVGEDLPDGEFLAAEHQKGIWRKALGPGKYRMNPYGYTIDLVDAISIPIGYAGVITSQSGTQAPHGEFAAEGQKGVRQDVLQPGFYYVNPKEFKVDVLEIGVNQVSLLGRTGGEVIMKGQMASQNYVMEQLEKNVLDQQKQKRLDYLSKSVQSMQRRQAPGQNAAAQERADVQRVKQEYIQGDSMSTLGLSQFVEFPSRDGFHIRLDMTVEIELPPADIALIFSRYGDLPALVDKIIMPQITSVSRNKGSEYKAKDFIMGEGREKFQDDLTRTLAATLLEKRIVVHNALIRHVEVPEEILDPIQQASIAIEQNLTNMERQNTAKKLAELNTELSLIEQKREQVAQETEKIKAGIRADQEKQVAEIAADAIRRVAEIARDTAGIAADTVRKLGVADATAIKLVEGEKANGLQLKAKAFGDPVGFALLHFAEELNDDVSVNIIHSGPGTLWTDLKNARTSDLGGALMINPSSR
jgi:regulator of protease activity HflC (stomatin/prohibitin superfamily)